MESAPTVQGSMLLIDPESCSLYRQGPGIAVYRFASFPAASPDRALMTSTSTSRTTAVP